MSQKSVEVVIGKLVTDEEFREAFRKSPEAALDSLSAQGLELSRCERQGILSVDWKSCARLAGVLDPRIQKASLKMEAVLKKLGCLVALPVLLLSRHLVADEVRVSLAELLQRALAKNHQVAFDREGVVAAQAGIGRADAAYEIGFRLDARYRDHTDPVNSLISGAPAGEDAPNMAGFVTSASLSKLLPTGGSVSVTTAAGRDRTNNTFAPLSPSFSTAIGLEVRQPLLQNRSIDPARRAIRLARTEKDRSLASLKRTASDTVAAVESAYWSLVAARRDIQVRESAVGLAGEQLNETKVRVDAGLVAESDVAQPVAERERRKGDLYGARETLSRAQNALKTLVLDDASDPLWNADLVPSDAPEIAAVPVDLAAAIAQAQAERPEVAEAAARVAQREIEVTVAKDRVLPQLDAVAAYSRRGLAGSLNPSAQPIFGTPVSVAEPFDGGLGRSFGTIGENRFPDASIGVSLSIPIGNRAAHEDVTIAESGRRQATILLAQQRQRVATEVRNAATSLTTAAQRIEAARSAREAAETQLSAEKDRYGVGLTTSFFVLTRQNDLSQAQLIETAALTDYRRALAELARARGSLLSDRNITVDETVDRNAPAPAAGGGPSK